MDNLEKALQIAAQDLRACYEDDKIIAGRRHFDDYWARDAFFAIRGSKELGDLKVVKNTLQLFLDHQKENGQIPRKIVRHNTLLKYILKIRKQRKKIKPIYTSSVFLSKGVDQNSLLIIAFKMYIRKSNDLEFLEKNYANLKRAMFWFFGQDPEEDKLINEGIFSNWMDTVRKSGEVLYSNVLYCNALSSFAELSSKINKTAEQEHFTKLFDGVKKKINNSFWNGQFYADWLKNKKKYNFFDTAANFLAVYFNIADQDKAISIFDYLTKQLAQHKSKLIRTNYPAYPKSRLSPTRFMSFSPGYQNNYYEWLWINCFYAVALNKTGNKKRAKEFLNYIADVIVKYEHVYEVYKNSKPVEKSFFKSEVPFAWSAGMYIYAYKKIVKS